MFFGPAVSSSCDIATAHPAARWIIWKLLMIGQKAWRSLKGAELLRDVYEGRKFVDGKPMQEADKVKNVAA
jgi:hypothetical protein